MRSIVSGQLLTFLKDKLTNRRKKNGTFQIITDILGPKKINTCLQIFTAASNNAIKKVFFPATR